MIGIAVFDLASPASVVLSRTVTTGPHLRVTVADRGHPVNGLRLHLGGRVEITGKSGVAEFHDIVPGNYLLTTTYDDGVSDSIQLIVKAGGSQMVNVPWLWPAVPPIEVRSLCGTLKLVAQPAEQSPRAFQIEVVAALSGRALWRGQTIASGEFDFATLPDGLYFLNIKRPGAPHSNHAWDIDGKIGIQVNSLAELDHVSLAIGITSCGPIYTNTAQCPTSDLEAQSLEG
jgi:hypothetical protein